jgi:hypothetical protein
MVRSRWQRLIPVVFITYSLAYLDRANFAFGVAGGMAKDLNITPATSTLLGSLFFLGYFFFQIPGAHYAAKKSAKKLVFWSLILWGVLATYHRYHQRCKMADRDPFYAGSGRKRGNACHADLSQQVVHQERTLKGKCFSDPW